MGKSVKSRSTVTQRKIVWLLYRRAASRRNVERRRRADEADKSAEVLYNVVYHHFSEVVHWSPSGVVGEGLDSQKEAALNSTFHCLCDMTKYVNKIYPTKGLDYKLKNVYSRYVSAMRGDAKALLHNFRLNEAK